MNFITFTSNHRLMKNFILLALLAFSFNSFAQTIPWATQQPKWVFPIYAKDANGVRDTIYFCYQPGASSSITDTNFGEVYFSLVSDSISFVATYTNFGLTDTTYMKADVSDMVSSMLYLDVEYYNFRYPLTIYFNTLLLRSDSLPYPDASPYPKASFLVRYNCNCIISNNTSSYCNPSDWILVSDTADILTCGCVVNDSIVFQDIFADTSLQSGVFTFEVLPWNGCYNGLDKILLNENEIIYPNPAADFLQIQSTKSEYFQIIDIIGNIVVDLQQIKGQTIPIGSLQHGVFTLVLFDRNKTNPIKSKFIKE